MSRFLAAAACLVACSTVFAQDDRPVQPTAEDSIYQLSNIRREAGAFGAVIAVDYKRTREGDGRAYLAAKSSQGRLQLNGVGSIDDASGTVKFRDLYGLAGSGVELYLVRGTPERMVSNAVRLGNPGAATTPRQMTPRERAQAERIRIANTPPASLPDGYVAVTKVMDLPQGTPVKAGLNGQWVDAEYMGDWWQDRVLVLYNDGRPHAADREPSKWLAIAPETLVKAKSSPDSFSPSVELMPEGRLIIPEGYSLVEQGLKLPKETPLRQGSTTFWTDVHFIEDEGQEIAYHQAGRKTGSPSRAKRNTFIIADDVRAKLDDPAAVAEWAEAAKTSEFDKRRAERQAGRAERMANRGSGSSAGGTNPSSRRNVKNYPITIDVPKDAEIVPEDLEVPDGTKLGAEWGKRWRKLTLVRTNEDGTLRVSWDDFGAAFDGDMSRDQLIIARSEVRKLRRLANMAAEEGPAAGAQDGGRAMPAESRTWQDASGQFEIEGQFVRLDGTTVHLETPDGETMTIELSQLSEADRTYVKSQSSDSPFRPRP